MILTTFLFDMYIEVYYLSKMNYTARKVQTYSENEIDVMYSRAIGKLISDKKQALVCIRNDEHDLIKSELLK